MGYHTHDTITRTHKSIKAMAISRNNRYRLTKTPKTSTLPLFSGDAAIALFRSSRWGLCTADLILVFTGGKSFFINKKKVTQALVWADLALFRVAIALNQHLPQGIVLWLQKQSWSWALRMCWMPYGIESKKSGLSAFIYARKLSLEKHVGDFFFLKWYERNHMWASNHIFLLSLYETHCITFYWKIIISAKLWSPAST